MSDQCKILMCSCEGTMPLDTDAVRRGCSGAEVQTAHQLCRAEIEKFRAAAVSGTPLIVGCTQEAPLFRESASERELLFANIRENAGWSAEADQAGPKMAALLAAAAEPLPPTPVLSLESSGVALICGSDERAIDAAKLLKDRLDVTVLLTGTASVVPPATTDFPVFKGAIRSAVGYLGAFRVGVEDCARALPSSRGSFVFGVPQQDMTFDCDIVIDLRGGPALFPAADLRDGYLRAHPNDEPAVLRAVLRAIDLVGTFDKPRYISFTPDLCAHSRSRIVGCRRCLDLCPTGAITPVGDHVSVDAGVCAGCGSCAAACPTGAASYALPASDALLRKLRILLAAYRDAGGRHPVLLLHDSGHGSDLIDALARAGNGLPANVLPLSVNEVTQIGLEFIAAAFAYGASACRVLTRERPRHDISGLDQTLALAQTILEGLGFGGTRITLIQTDEPDALGRELRAIAPGEAAPHPASFEPAGAKRDLLRLSLRELHRASPAPVEQIALPPGAPFGAVEVADGCTLCLSCVSACPTGALRDDPDYPRLRFAEDACVQCGLCRATCPERVITLVPRIDFGPAAVRTLKEEAPFCCIRCGKPFATRSTIERVTAKLQTHWMFSGQSSRIDVIKMCEDCRVRAVTVDGLDPYGAAERPRPRTSEDYIRERQEKS